MSLIERAEAHAALGDVKRLSIADRLVVGDCTVAELGEATDLPGNLLAHHLDVMEEAGLIIRRSSEGDRRRRYVSLRWARVPSLGGPGLRARHIAFVCTHNSARSQFAAALWEHTTGSRAKSGGSDPASRVHPTAVKVAAEFGVDISSATPDGYQGLGAPDLIVSVCDRAREEGIPDAPAHVHWSVPDPVPTGTLKAFRSAFADIAGRIENLVEHTKSEPINV
jgi:ArsR family transcriptional regulator, arsenate/arsenite/antimonite-responsive transcriptional repressor / arsenate reductase (thioredoxin)